MKQLEDRLLRLLNGREVLEKNIPTLREVFIKYYGEEHRKEIEEKFRKAVFIPYQSPSNVLGTVYVLEKNKIEELTEELFNEVPNQFKEEDRKKIIDFYGITTSGIENYKKLKEMINKGKETLEKEWLEAGYNFINRFYSVTAEEYQEVYKSKVIKEEWKEKEWIKENIEYYLDVDSRIKKSFKEAFKYSKEILNLINPNITEDNFEEEIKNNPEQFKVLEDLDKVFQVKLKEFEEYKKQFQEYNDIDKIYKDNLYKIRQKYYKDFINENKELIPESKKEDLEKFLTTENTTLDDKYVKKVLGYNLNDPGLIESFNKENDEYIKENDWRSKDIKKNRVEYFKINGLDLGDNYEDYLTNEQTKLLWPNDNIIKSVKDSKNKFLDKVNNEMYDAYKPYQELLKEKEKYQTLDKDDPINPNLYLQHGTYISPNIRKNNDKYELFTYVMINVSSSQDEMLDHYIIHELNHLYELHLNDTMVNEYTTTCGWEVITQPMNQEDIKVDTITQNETKRPYELFNEITNELIAQEISEMMINDNTYIFNDKETAQYKKSTSYEHTKFIIESFFNEYKDKIKESRINGNINIIFNEVGKENFDELNSLFQTFNENFSGMRVYALIKDLKENEQTRNTKIYREIEFKRDEILEKMRKYKNNKLENNYTI